MMRRCAILLLLSFAVCSPASAQSEAAQREAYAQHWPVLTEDASIYAVTLTPELYAQIQRSDLGDLAAFNVAGEALAFEPLASVWQIPIPPNPRWRAVHWFALPAARPTNRGEGLSLQVQKAADGSISLRAAAGAVSIPKSSGDLLIDTGMAAEKQQRLQALDFEFDPAITDFSGRVRIDVSGDLHSWQTLVNSASLLQLQQGGQLLQRRQIGLAGPADRYLRLYRLDADTPLPLIGLRVQSRDAVTSDPRQIKRLAAELVSSQGRTFLYRLPARIPIEQITLRLALDNTVAVADLASREDEGDPWRPRGSLTAFRLRAEGVELDNEAMPSDGNRDRHWRVEVGSDLSQAPTLEFLYQPERWLLLTQGEGPYVIAAGSHHSTRVKIPLASLLAPIRAKYGADWQPPEVALGKPVVAAGDAATEGSPTERWSNQLLCLVLIISALAIGAMVLRLLSDSTDSAV